MTTITEFDHSVLAVNDLMSAQRFYAEVLGEIVGRWEVGWPSMTTTEQMHRAVRLQPILSQKNPGHVSAPHASVTVGEAQIPLFLHRDHIQEPPPEQVRGLPRLAIRVTAEQMDKAVEVFQRARVRFEDVRQPAPSPIARSLYFKDPSSNFLELCCER
jgi:catechol 2,3-dioxygenase-like lactoylglutathione lyase family enzyme